jgi:hypothetical protein
LTNILVKFRGSNTLKTAATSCPLVKNVKKDWNELDDLVIKVLSSPERKNILRIVASYPEGVNYTGILGETMLSTGRLNYHLGELDGFLERDEERRYRLTELGRKAVAVLDFIKKDIDTSVLETLNTRRAERLRWIKRRMDIGYYIAAAILLGITGLMGYFAVTEWDPVLTAFTTVWGMMTAGIIYLMNRSRKRDPERILWLVEWLEWRLLGGYKERR